MHICLQCYNNTTQHGVTSQLRQTPSAPSQPVNPVATSHTPSQPVVTRQPRQTPSDPVNSVNPVATRHGPSRPRWSVMAPQEPRRRHISSFNSPFLQRCMHAMVGWCICMRMHINQASSTTSKPSFLPGVRMDGPAVWKASSIGWHCSPLGLSQPQPVNQ